MNSRRLLFGGLATATVIPAVLVALAPTAAAAGCTAKGSECYGESVTPHSFVAGVSHTSDGSLAPHSSEPPAPQFLSGLDPDQAREPAAKEC